MAAPVLNNLIVIGVLLAVPHLNRSLALGAARHDTSLLLWLGLGTTVGVAAQALVLLPLLKGAGVHLRWVWAPRHPAIRRVLRLAGWTLGYVVADQVSFWVALVLANREPGDVSASRTPTSSSSCRTAVARSAPRIAFSMFGKGKYDIYLLDSDEALAGRDIMAPSFDRANVLSREALQGTVAAHLSDAAHGLPSPIAASAHPYTPTMSLEGFGQPYLSSAGAGGYVRARRHLVSVWRHAR